MKRSLLGEPFSMTGINMDDAGAKMFFEVKLNSRDSLAAGHISLDLATCDAIHVPSVCQGVMDYDGK
jgi:hypothetical protein